MRGGRRAAGGPRVALGLVGAGLAAGAAGGVGLAGVWMAGVALGGGDLWEPARMTAAVGMGVEAMVGGAGTVAVGLALIVGAAALGGVVFALLVGRERGPAAAGLAGVVFAAACWALHTFLLAPLLDPTLAQRVRADPVPWTLGFAAYGLALGVVPALRRRWEPVHEGGRAGLWALVALAALAVAVRAAAPVLVERVIDRELAENPDYGGGVSDVDLALWRGAARVEGLQVLKREGKADLPFLSVPVAEGGIDWRALTRGEVVAWAEVREPEVNVVVGPPDRAQTGLEVDWRAQLQEILPVRIDRMEIADGTVRLRDHTRDVPLDVELSDLDVMARNLTNSLDVSESLFATIDVSAKVFGEAPLGAHLVVDPYASPPTFSADLSLERLPLKRLNPFLERYGRVDVERGRLDWYAEVASRDGRFRGYAKPLFTDVKVVRIEEELAEGDRPARVAWEALVSAAVELTEDQARDRTAARVGFEGTFRKPEVGLWEAVGSVFRNAFVQALFRGLEHSIDLGDVPTRRERERG